MSGILFALSVPLCHQFGTLPGNSGAVWHTRKNHAKLQTAIVQEFMHGKVIA